MKQSEIVKKKMMDLIKNTLNERIETCPNKILEYEDTSLESTKYSEFLTSDYTKSII